MTIAAEDMLPGVLHRRLLLVRVAIVTEPVAVALRLLQLALIVPLCLGDVAIHRAFKVYRVEVVGPALVPLIVVQVFVEGVHPNPSVA